MVAEVIESSFLSEPERNQRTSGTGIAAESEEVSSAEGGKHESDHSHAVDR
jgi:hypothetical protein